MINQFLGDDNVSRALKVFASIIPQAALQQGSYLFAEYECTGVGLTEVTAGAVFNNYSFNTALAMLTVSAIVFTVLGLYLDKVIPSRFGSTRSIIFCLKPSHYGCCKSKSKQSSTDDE